MWLCLAHKVDHCSYDSLEFRQSYFSSVHFCSLFAAVLRPLFAMNFNSSTNALDARHIQSGQGTAVHYWCYATRYLPCTSDAGSCEYLDSVYGNHEKSMIYTFIMWAVIGMVLLVAVFSRLLRPSKRSDSSQQSFWYRSVRSASATIRRYLTPECSRVFKYTTRLQVVIFAILCAYLIAFS